MGSAKCLRIFFRESELKKKLETKKETAKPKSQEGYTKTKKKKKKKKNTKLQKIFKIKKIKKKKKKFKNT